MRKTLFAGALVLAVLVPLAASAKTLHSPHVTIVQSDQPVKRTESLYGRFATGKGTDWK